MGNRKLPRVEQEFYYDAETGTESYYSDEDEEEKSVRNKKRKKVDNSEFVLPPGFLQPLNQIQPLSVAPLSQVPLPSPPPPPSPPSPTSVHVENCNQFWKAGDYEVPTTSSSSTTNGLDHARVHPKFLHSNATSHKWALGAFAELLDNAVDEISHGATYVTVDVLDNKKDKNKMLLVQDNGGGMNARTIRHCMSLGYSVKSKIANTIGQYGNGFKTSTMRLGADVIVFTRFRGKNGENPTQSIGMLSYTFLRSTGKDDIVVPILDYEKRGADSWKQVIRSSVRDWNTNLDSILKWSPFSSEEEFVKEFELMGEQGTRVIIYNLWDLEEGMLELDFDTDPDDIQLRGINKDEQKIEMGKKYPSTRHFVTYQHSLRSYVSILYLRLPAEFRIVLRGKIVKHHSLVDDMMLPVDTRYTPSTPLNQYAPITLGFVKDAKDHVDIQGFSVYHKNRLIKAFWKVWNTTSCSGRGIIGVVEANFVEPAHDKQSFESTPVLDRLKLKLNAEQKKYWRINYGKVGYIVSHKKRSRKKKSPELVISDNDNDDHQPARASPVPEGPVSEEQSGHASDNGRVHPCQNFTVPRTKRTEAAKRAPCLNVEVENHQQLPRREVCRSDPQVSTENIVLRERSRNLHRAQPEEVSKEQDQPNTRSDAELLAENIKTAMLKEFQAFRLKVKANLMEKDQQIERLKIGGTEKDQQIEKLKVGATEKDQQIERLKNGAIEKDQQIKRLKIEATEKDQQIERLKYIANVNDQQSEQLKREAKARIEAVNQERSRRDDEEAILRMKLMEAHAVIEKLQTKGKN